MVLPPPLGQGVQLADFRKINRRFLIKENDAAKLRQQFDVFYQLSGIAHSTTPPAYHTALATCLDDMAFKDRGTPIMGLFARLIEAVGGGICYHNECCQG
jgi:hypothetical protein